MFLFYFFLSNFVIEFYNIVFNVKQNLDSLFEINFYSEDQFYLWSIFIEVFPELLLSFCILHSLISVFNDSEQQIFQYYRWMFYFTLLFVIFFSKLVVYTKTIFKIILGFSWMSSLYILFSKCIILFLTLIIFLIIKDKVKKLMFFYSIIDFPMILAFSILFMLLLNSSYDFFGVYLSLEGLSLTLYVLASILNQSAVSIEATIKYFSLGAISTGVLLWGLSILYNLVGCLDFLEVQIFIANSTRIFDDLLEIKFACLLILFSFFFKVGSFPMHIWVADVYEGIWTPITAFFAIVIKVGLFLFLIRIIFNVIFGLLYFFQPVLLFMALGSIAIGSLGALRQVRIKRFVAYASINQVGFLILGLSCCNILGLISTLLYLMLYAIMSLILFAIVINSSHIVTEKNITYLSDLYDFSKFNIESGKYLIFVVLSMAGLPPTGGFVGKVFIYIALINARLDAALMFTLLFSVISTYYYLSFVRHIIFERVKTPKLFISKHSLALHYILTIFSIFLLIIVYLLPYILPKFVLIALSCMYPASFLA